MSLEFEDFTEIPCMAEHTQCCDCRFKGVNGRELNTVVFRLKNYDLFSKDGFDPQAKNFFGILCEMIFNPEGWHHSLVEGEFLQLKPLQKNFIHMLIRERKSRSWCPEHPLAGSTAASTASTAASSTSTASGTSK